MYSSRSPARDDLFGAVFISVCFLRRSAASTDDADITMPIKKADYKKTSRSVVTDDKLPLLGLGMIGIRKDARMRIGKHRNGVFEGDAVLANVT